MATTITAVDRVREQQDLVIGQARLMLEGAQRAGRTFEPDEEKKYADLLAQSTHLAERIKGMQSDEELLANFEQIRGGPGRRPAAGRNGRSWGAEFTAATSEFFRAGGHRAAGTWVSPAVMIATTLTEDAASGGALVPPQLVPDIVPFPTRPMRVAELFAAGQTSSNTIRLMLEKTFTNAAAPVAEGSAKPESALVFEAVDEPTRKVAHWLPVTEELLEDAPTSAAFIDGRLRLGVLLAEDDQLLNGNGTPPNLLGILNRSGLTATITQTTETVADAIAAQLAAVATASNLQPDGVVIHPTDWLKIATVKDTTGAYLATGAPFVTMNPPMIWGVPAAITTAIAVKTVLVGAFQRGGQVFRHATGLRVEASNSHQDFFIKNLVAIRAELRLALAVYRPGAFGKVVLA